MAGSAWPMAGGIGSYEIGMGAGVTGVGREHRRGRAREPVRAAVGSDEAGSDEGGRGLWQGRAWEPVRAAAGSGDGWWLRASGEAGSDDVEWRRRCGK
jgi:hypothetical protein